MKKLGEHFKIYTGKKIKMNLQVYNNHLLLLFQRFFNLYGKENDFVNYNGQIWHRAVLLQSQLQT